MKTVYAFGAVGFIVAAGAFLSNGGNKAEAGNPGRPVANAVKVEAPSLLARQGEVKTAEITLGAGNMVLFRTPFDAVACAKAQQELLAKDRALPGGQPIFLILDTPGGSIDAGSQLIDTARSLNRPVHTVTIFAASMGFVTAQSLGQRYILPSGTLMAHRARVGGVGGQVPGEFITAVGNIVRMVERIETRMAKRLGISLDEYTKLVVNEYWVTGEDAVRQNAADALATLRCDETLQGTHTESMQTLFGPIDLEWSNCPAVTNPIGYKFTGSAEYAEQVKKAFTDYRQFRRSLAQ